MKVYQNRIMISACIMALISSCNLTQLDTPADGEGSRSYIEPATLPATVDAFENEFHGGSQKTWRTLSFTLAGLDGLQDCRLDDVMLINADGTYQYDGGETLCRAEDSERIRTGTWEVNDDGRSITFDRGTVREYTTTVNGLESDIISVSGQYIGLAIKGIYTSAE